MLESQRKLDDEVNEERNRFQLYASRKDVSVAMGTAGGEVRANNGFTWWERLTTGTVRCFLDIGRELLVQTWRDRPRDAASILTVVRRNLVALTLILISGIITWESSVDDLRTRIDRTIIFPLYLPQSVALAVACVWTTAVVPGSLVGLYLVRLYMIWRLHLGFTSVNTTIMLLVALLAVVQSHIGAFFLRRFLCRPGTTKRIPTIDSVKEAVWYVVTVFVLSLSFGMLITLCISVTPLIHRASFWRYWATWWLGVLASMITVTPLLTHLLAWDYQSSLRSPGNLVECVLVALTTSATMVVVFFLNFDNFRPLPYLCFPLITWTAFRFNKVGWALTVSVIAYCSAVGSIRKRGAFYSITDALPVSSPTLILQIELFSCVMGVVAITLAAAVREKQSLTRKLHQLNVKLEETVDMRTLELRKANEELQVSQKKAEQASHAKSDFLANMSHEIRTPIHGILGLTALLLESELTPDQEESLVSVKECADLLLHIINSVLDLAKIEAGRLEVEKVPFNIRKLVSSTFRMLQARAQQRGLQLKWEIDKSVPQTLVGDVGKLQQCLMNLVGNALKFTHKGSVTVSVKAVAEDTIIPHDEVGNRGIEPSESKQVESVVPDSMAVQFEVRDTGIGISAENLQDMFKPFTQADASTSRLYGGTGLGLCIVQRFVELLGGNIWAESEVNIGSAFHFRLPFLLNNPKESPSDASPKVSAKNYPEKLTSRQSWSLMGGLIFSPHPTDAEAGAPTRSSNLCSRGRSTNDLLELWKENNNDNNNNNTTNTTVDDSDSSESSPAMQSRPSLLRQASSDVMKWPSPERLHWSRSLQAENRRSLEKTRSDPVLSRDLMRSGSGRREPFRSDGSASNEVTQVGPSAKESLTMGLNSVSLGQASSRTSSTFSDWEMDPGCFFKPHESPMDSDSPNNAEEASASSSATGVVERDRGQAHASTGPPLTDSTSVRSDLSRESSAELELMLSSKLSLNILLAEDNAINQKVASRQLEKHGHVVSVVGDGQQALDIMSSRHDDFDLVLMDVQMPVMDGLKATDLIRKAECDNGWTRVPILGLTAHAIQGYQETCLRHGMDGYLGKPFDIHQLLKTIGHLLPPGTLGQHILSR